MSGNHQGSGGRKHPKHNKGGRYEIIERPRQGYGRGRDRSFNPLGLVSDAIDAIAGDSDESGSPRSDLANWPGNDHSGWGRAPSARRDAKSSASQKLRSKNYESSKGATSEDIGESYDSAPDGNEDVRGDQLLMNEVLGKLGIPHRLNPDGRDQLRDESLSSTGGMREILGALANSKGGYAELRDELNGKDGGAGWIEDHKAEIETARQQIDQLKDRRGNAGFQQEGLDAAPAAEGKGGDNTPVTPTKPPLDAEEAARARAYDKDNKNKKDNGSSTEDEARSKMTSRSPVP